MVSSTHQASEEQAMQLTENDAYAQYDAENPKPKATQNWSDPKNVTNITIEGKENAMKLTEKEPERLVGGVGMAFVFGITFACFSEFCCWFMALNFIGTDACEPYTLACHSAIIVIGGIIGALIGYYGYKS